MANRTREEDTSSLFDVRSSDAFGWIEKLKTTELKNQLKLRKLKTTGTRSELQNRLRVAIFLEHEREDISDYDDSDEYDGRERSTVMQDRPSSKFLKSTRPGDPEGSSPQAKSREIRNMIRSKWKWSWVFNGIIVLGLGLVIMVLEFDVITFRPLGYRCNDPNLSHKYKGDTINFACLATITLLLPFVSIFLVEFFGTLNLQNYRKWLKKRTFCIALHWYGEFFLGLLILLIVVELSKSIVAEPRPHFFDTCKPDKFNCTGYVTEYVCTNEDVSKKAIRDSCRSFPSGHSAMAFYVSVFLMWFFQSRIPNTDYLIVPVLQCIVLSWGLICALTRITDRRHHWWDVLIGSTTGVLLAIFTAKILCRNFRYIPSGRVKKQDRIVREGGSSINSWYKKAFNKSSSVQQPDDKELREVK